MPKPIVVQPGDRYGMLVVIREMYGEDTRHRKFECRCDCGKTYVAQLQSIVRENGTKSCGCLKRSRIIERNSRHLDHGSPEYRTWKGMIYRCESPNSISYRYYGAIGITVCEEWRNNYAAFLAHVGRKPTPQHSIDRYPNPAGNYEPGNVRWATGEQQNNNKRR